jgi:hypothetical protein
MKRVFGEINIFNNILDSYLQLRDGMKTANKLTQHIESKLNGDEKEILELDLSIEEIKNVLKILKPNKSRISARSPLLCNRVRTPL